MALADFIEENIVPIVDDAVEFTRTLLPACGHLDEAAIRDHLPMILQAVVADLRRPQTPRQEFDKSQGAAIARLLVEESAAESHALLRAKAGFQIEQMVSEYRALRASVLRRWRAEGGAADAFGLDDIARFNEAIDQAIAESVAFFSREAQRWRNVFLAVLGHDLRGPLNAVLLTAELLAQLGSQAPAGDYTDRLIRSGRRMQELLDSLLDYSRSTLGQGIGIVRNDVDLAEACRDELAIVGAALPGQKIELVVAGDTRGGFDASRVRESLGNLVFNAARYSTAGSTIVVTLAGDGTTLSLTVENAGPPIATDLLPTLFDPLRRGALQAPDASQNRANLGLGLFIVQEVARAHGGDVQALSDNGKTRFTMTLPIGSA